jgi:hypothetical protein
MQRLNFVVVFLPETFLEGAQIPLAFTLGNNKGVFGLACLRGQSIELLRNCFTRLPIGQRCKGC